VSITSSFRAYVLAGLAALVMLLAVPLSAHAATDIYLKFDNTPNAPGLQGESIDKAYPNAIKVSEFSWGIENPVTIGSAGAGAGKAKFEELEIKKPVDAGSPGLMAALGKGAMIPNAWLVVRGDSAQKDAYVQYRLKTVFVTKINNAAAAGDEGVYETVTLQVGGLQQRYVQTRANGTLNPIVNGWDQMVNATLGTDWTAPVF
jgi:type VI secretion system Hcp family effector